MLVLFLAPIAAESLLRRDAFFRPKRVTGGNSFLGVGRMLRGEKKRPAKKLAAESGNSSKKKMR